MWGLGAWTSFSSCSEQGPLSSGDVQASHGGFSCCGAQGPGFQTSVVVASRL